MTTATKTQAELFAIYQLLPDFGGTTWEHPDYVRFELVGQELRIYPESALGEEWIGAGEYLGFNVENYL